MTSPKTTPEEVWGPMAQPIHTSVPGNSKAIYKDNAYVTCWDVAQNVFFTMHCKSTPNGPNPGVRISVGIGSNVVEVHEPLTMPGTYNSKSFTWDHAGRIVLNTPDLSFDLRLAPRFIPMNDAFLPFLPSTGGPPLNHWERTVDVEGSCEIKGRKLKISAKGYRDRSIGFRDETMWNECILFFGTFPDYTITFVRMVSENFDRQGGFLYDEKEARKITKMGITRNASALFAAARFEFEDGGKLQVRTSGGQGGFWVPMGVETEGPAMADYEEFCPFRTDDGVEGFGFFEQGVLRKTY